MPTLMPLLIRYSKVLCFIVAAFILVLLTRWVKRFLRRRAQKKEIDLAAAHRLRDENLNQIILNNHTGGVENREIYKPYDVDYNGEGSGGFDNMNIKARQTMIQLVEHTRLSTRKYVLNPAKKIRIGSDLQGNEISVVENEVAPHQCEIFEAQGKVYIRHTGGNTQTIIRRKRQSAIADKRGIRLHSGDRIEIGSVSYEITITD